MQTFPSAVKLQTHFVGLVPDEVYTARNEAGLLSAIINDFVKSIQLFYGIHIIKFESIIVEFKKTSLGALAFKVLRKNPAVPLFHRGVRASTRRHNEGNK